MAAGTNLSGGLRFFYIVLGAALMAWGFYGTSGGWVRYVLCILGALILLFGLIAFCPIRKMLGVGGENQKR